MVIKALDLNGDDAANVLHENANVALGKVERQVADENGTTVAVVGVEVHALRVARPGLHSLLEVVGLDMVDSVQAESLENLLGRVELLELDADRDGQTHLLLDLVIKEASGLEIAEGSEQLVGLLDGDRSAVATVDDVSACVKS